MSRSFSQIAPERRKAIFRHALVASLPVLMGYVTMGFAAGVLMAAKGSVPVPPLWAGLCGAAFISGTLSFAIVAPIAASAPLWSVALLALGINFRYAFYGFSMLGRWRGAPFLQKCFLIHSLADEIYALDVACKLEDPLEHRYYCLWNGALNASYWVFGTTAGGLAGCSLPIPSRGIEFAMVALFLVIFTDQIREALFRHGR